MSREAFDRFRDAVRSDDDLQARIRDITDWQVFPAAVTELAVELGWDVSRADVDAALREARMTWIERWI